MLERVVYLRRAIDSWTRSKPIFEPLILTEHEWKMVEFLVHFLYPFMVANTVVQETARPSLHDTWVRYEEMFDCLDNAKMALNALTCFPNWLREVQTAVEKMWSKLREYYDRTDRPFAYIDATLLHPALKASFMKKAKYSPDDIERYKKEGESRFQKDYDNTRPAISRRPLARGKRRRPSISESDSSDGVEFNEFTSYLATK